MKIAGYDNSLHCSLFVYIFPFVRLTINNNNNAIYAPMDNGRPCYVMTHFKF